MVQLIAESHDLSRCTPLKTAQKIRRVQPWITQDWDASVPVLDDVVLNLAELLHEEGIEF